MLTPHRLMNLNYCVVGVASAVLACLLERGSSSLDGILGFCSSVHQEVNEQDITLAVSFLYLLGRVEYDEALDFVILVDVSND